jgi:hypothetical protein
MEQLAPGAGDFDRRFAERAIEPVFVHNPKARPQVNRSAEQLSERDHIGNPYGDDNRSSRHQHHREKRRDRDGYQKEQGIAPIEPHRTLSASASNAGPKNENGGNTMADTPTRVAVLGSRLVQALLSVEKVRQLRGDDDLLTGIILEHLRGLRDWYSLIGVRRA